MTVGNNGLLAGLRKFAPSFRGVDIDSGIQGSPLGWRLRGAVQSGPPAAGTAKAGDQVPDRAGNIWVCIQGGTPGVWTRAGYVYPSGDLTGVKDTAAVQAAMAAGARLGPGTFWVSNLLIDSQQYLAGSGQATVLQPVAGTTGYVVALKNPATTRQVTIRDLTIFCQYVCAGIQVDNTGFTPTGSYVSYDPLHVLDNIWVTAAAGDAYHLDNNVRGMTMRNCRQYWATGYGFYLGPGAGAGGAGCTDCHFTGCMSGTSGNHGFYIASGSSDNMFAACKSFWAGYNYEAGTWGTTGCGWEIAGNWNVLTGCNSQQSALHGYDLQSCASVALAGCNADTNSAGASVTTGVGINLNAATNCAVTGCTGSNNGSLSPGAQAYGMQVNGTMTGTALIGNPVSGSSGGLNNVGGSGYLRVDDLSADFSSSQYLKFCSPVLAPDGVQALSSSSTIHTATDGAFAAVPLSATGACTGLILEAPGNTWSMIALMNQSAFPLTFAASGTSNVAGGTSVMIPPLGTLIAVYDGNTSLWSTQNWATLPAGTASAAPLTFQSGTNLTTAAAGSAEYDGTSAYFTNETTSGRGLVPVEQKFRLTATGGTISTIANYFGTTSNISLVSGGEYEIEIDCWFLKSTAGTVTWTFTSSAAPTSMNLEYKLSPATGVVSTAAATALFGEQYNLTSTAPTVVSASLTTAVNHHHKFWIRLINGTGTSLKIQATAGAGTITPGIGSYWKARRVPAANVGAFAA